MYAVFDIGGTKTRVSISNDLEKFDEPKVFPTEKDLDKEIGKIKEVLSGQKIEAICGGLAGVFDNKKTRLLNSPHLSKWIEAPIKDKLKNTLSCEVFLENDSALVGLGEAVNGAGKENSIVAYITVSTGVGGARIVDGKIDRNIFGFEPGHQIIDINGTVCPGCGDKGHLEGFISGFSLQERTGKRPKEVIDEKIWEEEAKLLATGLNNIAVLWSPDVIVLGGSMIVGSPCIPIEHVERHFNETLKIFPNKPKIKRAELGDFGGLYGGLKYLKDKQ
jgi:predicted NBD/HSP70 family sugar kinase